ncbi:MAG: iron-regulated protein [Rhodospirillaceae bacterium]|nr:iron-regulated protein [Rhodospirillaceae bacterium]
MSERMKMSSKRIGVLAICAGLMATPAAAADYDASAQIDAYATLVYTTYKASYDEALKLRSAIDTLLADPTDANLKSAKAAWIASREPYGRTEAFRFYDGPIDFYDADSGEEGPEALLNSWPLNEAYIDYVEGNPESGIIFDPSIEITPVSLAEDNQMDDEADVSTGYHAVEFLLWGQDMNADGPGNRPVSDFAPGESDNERRRAYLEAATDLLIQNLSTLVDAWKPGADNYAAEFKAMDQKEALQKMMTGMATLAEFELASERMSVALDSGYQEDEHSCFSDNTHRDLIANADSVRNVYFADYGSYDGAGLNELVAEIDPALNDKMVTQFQATDAAINAIPHPFDQVLVQEKGSADRQKVETAISALQAEAATIKEIGQRLGIDVIVVTE